MSLDRTTRRPLNAYQRACGGLAESQGYHASAFVAGSDGAEIVRTDARIDRQSDRHAARRTRLLRLALASPHAWEQRDLVRQALVEDARWWYYDGIEADNRAASLAEHEAAQQAGAAGSALCATVLGQRGNSCGSAA